MDIVSELNMIPDPQTRAVLQRIFEGMTMEQMQALTTLALPPQVSGAEITAGDGTAIRSYSPANIVAMIAEHETT